MNRVLVLGWYGHHNLGDEAFKDAFCYLWPHFQFDFCDTLPQDLTSYCAIWIGGGSLFDKPQFKIPVNIPLGLIGVSFSSLSSDILSLLERAEIVIVRDSQSHKLYSNSILASDLTFALPYRLFQFEKFKKITIFLNDFLSPKRTDPEWKSLSHYYFVSSFAETCNFLIKNGYSLNFVPLGIGEIDDRRVAGQIISKIDKKSKVNWDLSEKYTYCDLENKIAESDFIITQRLHGMIFSIRLGVPFIAISAHDKIKNLTEDLSWAGIIDYYNYNDTLFSETNFKQLQEQSIKLIEYSHKASKGWLCISDIVTAKFSPSAIKK